MSYQTRWYLVSFPPLCCVVSVVLFCFALPQPSWIAIIKHNNSRATEKNRCLTEVMEKILHCMNDRNLSFVAAECDIISCVTDCRMGFTQFFFLSFLSFVCLRSTNLCAGNSKLWKFTWFTIPDEFVVVHQRWWWRLRYGWTPPIFGFLSHSIFGSIYLEGAISVWRILRFCLFREASGWLSCHTMPSLHYTHMSLVRFLFEYTYKYTFRVSHPNISLLETENCLQLQQLSFRTHALPSWYWKTHCIPGPSIIPLKLDMFNDRMLQCFHFFFLHSSMFFLRIFCSNGFSGVGLPGVDERYAHCAPSDTSIHCPIDLLLSNWNNAPCHAS